MERNLFRYIWRRTRSDQLWVLFVIIISMPIYFLSLELPKRIVNSPIQGNGFEQPGSTSAFLRITLPDWLSGASGETVLFGGFELTRMQLLVALSLTFLALVCLSGIFKFYINTFKGRMGERMLRRLRFELVDRLLRFPVPHFRRVKAPEIATMVKDEVEPLGGFIGNAFVQPVFLGGQAATALVFILIQSFWLGSIAAGIVLAQAFIIPRLRRRLLVLGKERQLTARMLAGRVGEIVEGISEIRSNDTSNYERAHITALLSRIFKIRYELYQRKFFVKFLNNFLAQITPFLFYLVGGYFALRGQLDIGQLVAVIAAYKDLPGPIKELIDWDQQRQDVQIKYNQVVEQFDPMNMVDPKLQAASVDAAARLDGAIDVSAVSITDDTGARLLESVSFEINPGEQIAALGEINAGAETMAEALARLLAPTSGRIRINDQRLEDYPESVTGRRIAYLGQETYLANTSLENSLLYALKHVPVRALERNGDAASVYAIDLKEAKRAGNSILDIEADWLDYDGAGVAERNAMRTRLLAVLDVVDLHQDVFELGLRGQLPPDVAERVSERVLEARLALVGRLKEPDMAGLVESFDPERYTDEATVGENLLFGTALSPDFAADELPTNPTLLHILEEKGIDERLYLVGRNIAETVIELFADLPPNTPFFEQLTFMSADEIPGYAKLLQSLMPLEFDAVSRGRRAKMLRLALAYIEPRHRLDLIDEKLKGEILEARAAIKAALGDAPEPGIAFYDPEAFNLGASLEENILFGRVRYGIADGPRRVRDLIREVLNELDMHDVVFEAGLAFEVGAGGKRLTPTQRQKIGLARALLKRPDIFVINRAFSGLSSAGQRAIVERILAYGRSGATDNASDAKAGDGVTTDASGPADLGFTLFWVLASPQYVKQFDRVLVFNEGRISEQGTPEELQSKGGDFARLVG